MTATARFSDDVHANVLYRMWWAIALKGLLFGAFAFLVYFWQARSLPGVIMLFAAFGLADGLVSILGAVRGGGMSARAGLAAAGVVSIIAAGLALWPGLSWQSLATVVGLWAAVRGAFEFVSAFTLRRYMERDWSLSLIGAFSFIFGVALALRSGMDPWNFVRLLATYTLVIGVLWLLLARRFRRGLRP